MKITEYIAGRYASGIDFLQDEDLKLVNNYIGANMKAADLIEFAELMDEITDLSKNLTKVSRDRTFEEINPLIYILVIKAIELFKDRQELLREMFNYPEFLKNP